MEREKMVEEIENILFEYDCHEVSAPWVHIKYAHDIIDAIIPEGAVVLTREELETTDKIPQKIKDFYKWFIEIEREQASKEKAAEILNKIANIDDCGFPMKSYVWFQEIAKENGVEVK